MNKKRLAIGGLIVLVVLVGGYFGYTYLKEKPPGFLIKLLTHTSPPPPLPAGDIAPLSVPEGFIATIYSREVPGARVLARDPRGTLLVSETSEGKVVALPDEDGDGKADRTVTVLGNLDQPHGLLVECPGQDPVCTLYVAETGSLKSYTYDPASMMAENPQELAVLPKGDGHFTRTLLPNPDGESILISVGSSCNVCGETDPHRATVLALNRITSELSVVARGLRNTVFMAIDPVFGKVWGTDNGRDVIGDDIPPDEVNIIAEGGDYGWPICYGAKIHDTDFDKKQYFRDPCADTITPHIELQAHSAALGIAFIPEEGWPDDMYNDLLVAYHGSWNRSEPTGYKVVRFDLDESRNVVGGPQDFLTGFLAPGAKPGEAIGRPVGLLAEPGGVVYVSDDRAGAVYRVSWQGVQ